MSAIKMTFIIVLCAYHEMTWAQVNNELSLTCVDRTKEKRIALTNCNDIFRGPLRIDPVPNPIMHVKTPISLKNNKGLDQKVHGVFFTATGKALVQYLVSDRGVCRISQKVDIINLNIGAKVGSVTLPALTWVIDVSADGTRVVTKTQKNRIDVWSMTGVGGHIVGFLPFGDKQRGWFQNMNAIFIDQQYLLTNDSREMQLWKVPECRAVWTLLYTGKFAVSLDRKYVAIMTKEGIVLIESLSGRILGKLANSSDNIFIDRSMFFSPDGTQLAVLKSRFEHSPMLSVFNLNTGEICASDIALPEYEQEPPLLKREKLAINWVSPGYIMLGGRHLFDLKKHMVIWHYVGHIKEVNHGSSLCEEVFPSFDPAEACGRDEAEYIHKVSFGGVQALDEKFWYLVDDCLTYAVIPQNVVIATCRNITKKNALVQPGVKVTVEVSVPNDSYSLYNSLVNKLSENGIIVTNDQPLRLVVNLTNRPGKTEKMKNLFTGKEFSVQTTDFKECVMFKIGEKIIWRRIDKSSNSHSIAEFVSTKEGETVQGQMDRVKVESENGAYFNVLLPKYIYGWSLEEPCGVGSTELTLLGTKDVVKRK